MPFLRFARDKRGYECTYVLHAYRPGQGPSRARVLYFFRSPAFVKIGRRAFEPEVREALEHTHPDLNFDWNGLLSDRPIEIQEPRERERRERPSPRPVSRPATPAPVAVPRASEPLVVAPAASKDASSELARIAGTDRAARLRDRYAGTDPADWPAGTHAGGERPADEPNAASESG